jgi:hypothetical protein
MTNLSAAHAASQQLKERVTRIALEDAATEIQRLRAELVEAREALRSIR